MRAPGIPKRERGFAEKRKLAAHVPTSALKHPRWPGRAGSTSTRNFRIPPGGLANETAPPKKYLPVTSDGMPGRTKSETDRIG